MSDFGGYLKETIRTANQSFEAGARAAADANTRKLKFLLGDLAVLATAIEKSGANDTVSIVKHIRQLIEDAQA